MWFRVAVVSCLIPPVAPVPGVMEGLDRVTFGAGDMDGILCWEDMWSSTGDWAWTGACIFKSGACWMPLSAVDGIIARGPDMWFGTAFGACILVSSVCWLLCAGCNTEGNDGTMVGAGDVGIAVVGTCVA